MADWPQLGPPSPIMLSTFNLASIGMDVGAAAMAAPASAALGTANLARGFPFLLPEPATVAKVWWYNGATANGNVDVGIYSEDGRLLMSVGSTAQGTASVLQEAVPTGTLTLGRGKFYMALATSSTTATFFTVGGSVASNLQLLKGAGCFQAASAFALPSTIAFAALAAALVPICGFSARSLVV